MMMLLKKLLKIIGIISLALFPFLAGALLGKHSPYIEGNSMTGFITIYSVFVVVVVSALIFITRKYSVSFVQPVLPGMLLFLLGCVMIGIIGFAVPPDLSIKMLDHPEREHLRYILLFMGALSFGLFFVLLLSNNSLQLNKSFKWIMIGMFALIMAELIWEFSHHYLYPDALKEWVDAGKKAEDFNKSYDDWNSITKGAAGRFLMYIPIFWLSLRLYKLRSIAIWNSILSSFLSILGIISSIVFFWSGPNNMDIPKALGFLMLFSIPGLPFLILYWIGVALLTQRNTQRAT